ncbi:DNA polymerase [Nocardiopsis sp. NPDC049922]|uniref:DNA polymerase n=1 Tax=Nocardiopsis sp. NPDC049922 TaxID=3155157 RepID=UPI0033E5E85A
MINLSYGSKRINVVENEDDLGSFANFVSRNRRSLAYDTETTGLGVYTPSFGVRLAQFGNSDESYVIPVEKGPRYVWYVRRTLEVLDEIVCHNATYDLSIAAQHFGCDLKSLYRKTVDTYILAHLVDSRDQKEGGTGHSLEALTGAYISRKVADEVKASMKELAKELKTTKSKVWSVVPVDHTTYNLYAGMDPILTYLLYKILKPKIPAESALLVHFEHEVARICAEMEHRGYLVDVDYTERLREEYLSDQEECEAEARYLGVENINSTDQVAEALIAQGVKLTEKTPSGRWKVDKGVLESLEEKGNSLAVVIQRAKRAGKWRSAYVDHFLDLRDENDRIHCGINSLKARTARMSITRPALQTLPSSEAAIRKCFLAESGHLTASIDYKAQELRVLAALSGDEVMKRAFEEGADLHQITADAAEVPRKVGKMANFLTVYGGGYKALALQAKIDQKTSKKVVDAFNFTYKGVDRFSKVVAKRAKGYGYVVTPTGRRLYVDKDRAYSATNYMVQSTSRDVTASALVMLDKAGLSEYLRLPVHDEIVASVPQDQADEIAHEIGRVMTQTLKGVEISTDPEVGGRSWGSLYEGKE